MSREKNFREKLSRALDISSLPETKRQKAYSEILRKCFGEDISIEVSTKSGLEKINGKLKEVEFPYSIVVDNDSYEHGVPFMGTESGISRILDEKGQKIFGNNSVMIPYSDSEEEITKLRESYFKQ